MQFTYLNRQGNTELTARIEMLPTAVRINRLRKSECMSRVWFDYLAKTTHRIVMGTDEVFNGTLEQCMAWKSAAQGDAWRQTELPITAFVPGFPAE